MPATKRLADKYDYSTQSDYSDDASDSDGPGRNSEPSGGSLVDRIFEAEVPSEFDITSSTFVPEGCLDILITRDAVIPELSEGDDYDDASDELDELAIFIERKAKKVFTILVRYMGWEGSKLVRAMRAFKDHDFTDESLPVPRPKAHNPGSHILDSLNPRKGRGLWSAPSIDNFFHSQWRVIVPVFGSFTGSVFHDLGPYHILPFIRRFDSKAASGSFGTVHEYRIHPNHISNQLKIKEISVGVKELRPGHADSWEPAKSWVKEVAVLQQLNTIQHNHIIRCIAAFRRGEPGRKKHYLMFDWADGGNLRDFWKAMPDPTLTPQFLKAVTKQLLGLADAICEFQSKFIRHGDLKPENILWFKNDDPIGTLKIADWGGAVVNTNIATELRGTETVFATRLYEAPEALTGKMFRLNDLWSMGCIMFELVTWLLYGIDGLIELNKEFRKQYAAFYQIERKEGLEVVEVHKVVVKWMDRMTQDPRCQAGATVIGDLLDLIRTRLLVVNLPPGLGALVEFTSQQSSQSPTAVPEIEVWDSDDNIRISVAPKANAERAPATELVLRMQAIYNNNQESYWDVTEQNDNTPLPELELRADESGVPDQPSYLQEDGPPLVGKDNNPPSASVDERGGILDEIRRGITSTARRRMRDLRQIRDLDLKLLGSRRLD
ncbi:kinase-like domain-containing protein [Rhypophila decipiens]|uniref:Kinase-like domain-containing protein n=1 Tax=Rhypophila decipiens TaxID=261697 RepID=A0AAN7B3F5_9PEZI|nr:kinase-like domain-containing protein [Rhypophila decipiens]